MCIISIWTKSTELSYISQKVIFFITVWKYSLQELANVLPGSRVRWVIDLLFGGAEYTKKALSFNYLFNKVSQFGFHSVTYYEILTYVLETTN